MLRCFLITILALILCSCTPAKPDPQELAEIARRRAANAARWEEERKQAEAWPENFLALTKTPVSALLDAWEDPVGVEADQAGARIYRWIKEYVSSSSSEQTVYDNYGYRIGSYEAPTAPVRELRCEIHIIADAAGLITNVRYAGPSCPVYFPLP